MSDSTQPNDKGYTYAFTMTPEIAQMFFGLCKKYNVTDEKDRIRLLMQLAKQGYLDSVVVSKKSPDEYLKHLKENFNVLDGRKVSDENTESEDCPHCRQAREADLQDRPETGPFESPEG